MGTLLLVLGHQLRRPCLQLLIDFFGMNRIIPTQKDVPSNLGRFTMNPASRLIVHSLIL
ncbi:hypothetical protein [Haloechinothrix halophila]|uniref:hypothetical protein n=1 Tax=Haloechinothrix halophila TaxID=1069073 RepID=UPI0012FC5644|nr:hypothetical protein [Haloechinothrix halophila]